MRRWIMLEDEHGEEQIHELPDSNEGMIVDIPYAALKVILFLAVLCAAGFLFIWAIWAWA